MKMEIWCGRSSDNHFRLRIVDEDANVEFITIKMTPENFAFMLANQPVGCEGEVRNLHRVGKTHMREDRSIEYAGAPNREVIIKWLREQHKDDGWEVNDTLSAQHSVVYVHKKGCHIINYSVEKWV